MMGIKILGKLVKKTWLYLATAKSQQIKASEGKPVQQLYNYFSFTGNLEALLINLCG